MQTPNQYLSYLIDPCFQGVNRFFLSFKDNVIITAHTGYFLPKVEIKDYYVMINERNLFDQPVKVI